MLTLLALKATKALLIACKEVVDLPQGRILDAAVEKYAIEILGERKVRQIQRAMRDPVKAALLIREPRTEDDGAATGKTTATHRSIPRQKAKKPATHTEAKASPRISYLREPEPED